MCHYLISQIHRACVHDNRVYIYEIFNGKKKNQMRNPQFNIRRRNDISGAK